MTRALAWSLAGAFVAAATITLLSRSQVRTGLPDVHETKSYSVTLLGHRITTEFTVAPATARAETEAVAPTTGSVPRLPVGTRLQCSVVR